MSNNLIKEKGNFNLSFPTFGDIKPPEPEKQSPPKDENSKPPDQEPKKKKEEKSKK